MKKGAMTTRIVLERIQEEMGLNKKQAQDVFDCFVESLGYCANFTDSLAINVTNLGTFYITENDLFKRKNEIKKRLANTIDEDNGVKLEQQIDYINQKIKRMRKQQHSLNAKMCANTFPTILGNILTYSRLNKSEISEKQNEYKKTKENK